MITVDQALSITLERVEPLGIEATPLEEALGRILAEDIIADIDLPPFDRARMDGFAVRSEDLTTSPTRLNVIGEIAAGATFDGTLGPGEAIKIFTGAPLPAGADSVQKVEVTVIEGDTVLINEPTTPGQFVTPHASEVKKQDVVAQAGRPIGAAEMAVLASFGYDTVRVGVRPRVAVISTGSELIEVSAKPTGAQIRNSNSYTLASYAEQAGAIVRNLGTVADTEEATRRALLEASEESDIVISSGGVSMGDYDLVKIALKSIDAEIYYDQVMIRPGKPTVFARRGPTYYFGLPGNPVSTSVTFNVFARPAMRKMQGERSPLLHTIEATLSRSIRDGSSRRSYLPARLYFEKGGAVAESLKWGGSSDLVAFMNANALIVVGEQVHEIEEGEMVQVLCLGPF